MWQRRERWVLPNKVAQTEDKILNVKTTTTYADEGSSGATVSVDMTKGVVVYLDLVCPC
eukprot:COSAG06_NODE_6590_length_2864_cov_3.445208_4_plen_59_part_00